MLVDLTAGCGIQVPSFADDGFGDAFAQLPGDEFVVCVRQLKPQCPRGVEPPCRDHWGDAAGQPDLFSEAAPDGIRMHISGELFGYLGSGKPHRLGRL